MGNETHSGSSRFIAAVHRVLSPRTLTVGRRAVSVIHGRDGVKDEPRTFSELYDSSTSVKMLASPRVQSKMSIKTTRASNSTRRAVGRPYTFEILCSFRVARHQRCAMRTPTQTVYFQTWSIPITPHARASCHSRSLDLERHRIY